MNNLEEVLQALRDNLEKNSAVEETAADLEEKLAALMPGDIVAVNRDLPYQHYAVYIGDGRVIHFAAPDGDWDGTPVVHEAPFENFLRDSKNFEVLEFKEDDSMDSLTNRWFSNDEDASVSESVSESASESASSSAMPVSSESGSAAPSLAATLFGLFEDIRRFRYHLYTPEETVERAKRVANNEEPGFDGTHYDLVLNNCEHFALWCKTGVKESKQISDIVKVLLR